MRNEIEALIDDVTGRQVSVDITRRVYIDIYGIRVKDDIQFCNNSELSIKFINFKDIESISYIYLCDAILSKLHTYIESYKQYNAIIDEYTSLNKTTHYIFKTVNSEQISIVLYYEFKYIKIFTHYNNYISDTYFPLDQFINFLHTLIEYKKNI